MAPRRTSASIARLRRCVAPAAPDFARRALWPSRIGWPIVVSLCLWLAWTGSAQGQQGPDQRPGWLLSAHPVVRVQFVQGRIAVSSLEVLPTTQAAAQTADGHEENLRIQTAGGGVCLHYTLTDEDRELVYDIQQGSEVRIKRRPRRDGAGVAVEYRQPPRGPVQLEIDDGQTRLVIRGTSLWHLLLTDPQPTRTHLAPLVEILRPSTRLATVADDVRGSLFQAAQAPAFPARDDIARLIRQLDSSEFRVRQGADRALRSMGPGIGPHLTALDPRTLSLEQRERVKAILDGLAGPAADTPERIAAWLATDPLVWVELLRDHDVTRRQTALSHMIRLTGGPISFDPLAAVNDRERQIDGLRRRFGLSIP